MGKNNTSEIKRISILIPAKDEEETIGLLLSDINKQIKNMPKYQWEIIVIADHCLDKTEELAKKHGVVAIKNQRPPGKGNALISGFEVVQGDLIIFMDADYSHNAEDLEKMIAPFLTRNTPVGLVIASRSLGGSGEYTAIRTLGNIFLTFCVNLLFHLSLTDSLNGYKAIRSSIIKEHGYSAATFEIEIELIYNTLLENKTIVEIPSYERERAGGVMKSDAVIHGTRFLWCIIRKGISYNLKHISSLFSAKD